MGRIRGRLRNPSLENVFLGLVGDFDTRKAKVFFTNGREIIDIEMETNASNTSKTKFVE